jgi:hypothetical protein
MRHATREARSSARRTGGDRACARALQQGHAGKKIRLSQNADTATKAAAPSATTRGPAHDDCKTRWRQTQFVEPRRPGPCAGKLSNTGSRLPQIILMDFKLVRSPRRAVRWAAMLGSVLPIAEFLRPAPMPMLPYSNRGRPRHLRGTHDRRYRDRARLCQRPPSVDPKASPPGSARAARCAANRCKPRREGPSRFAFRGSSRPDIVRSNRRRRREHPVFHCRGARSRAGPRSCAPSHSAAGSGNRGSRSSGPTGHAAR